MKFKSLFIAASFGMILFSCGSESSTESETSTSTTEDEVEEVIPEEDPWIECYFKRGGYSTFFPGDFESKIDTTDQFHIHISAFQNETRFYRVTAYVPINPIVVDDKMGFIQAMKESMNNNYAITEEQETAFGTYGGLLIYADRDGWSFSRFMLVENDLIYILDIAAEGELRPSNLEIEEFYGYFQHYPIDPT